jgi:uncharacterized iron-regulated membrane protein
MRRGLWVFIHRWAGLLMAGFLILVGVTGSLLAFNSELERLIRPQLYATPGPGAVPLDAAALAGRAETLVPKGQVYSISFAEPDQVLVTMGPRAEPETGTGTLGFNQLFLDPYTGDELGRRTWGDISQGWINLMPFIYSLHFKLALGMTGFWIMGIVALVWTLDCFVGFYLTLPVGMRGFWRHWKPAWLIKWTAGAFRINFDLHRAGSLWLWVVLLIFAWSSVYMNLSDTVYTWVMQAILVYRPVGTDLHDLPQANENPCLDWRAALSTGEQLMARQADIHGFTVERPMALSFDSEKGLYSYKVRSSRDVQDRRGNTEVYFDANTGEMRQLLLPSRQYAGNTVTSWLYALHEANVFGMPYRIFVSVLGLAITMLSGTGVYIWWRKRRARKFSAARRGGAADPRSRIAALVFLGGRRKRRSQDSEIAP